MRLKPSREAITAFCKKWKISELAFFGSVLRDDFRPESDVDTLVTFEEEARWSLFDFEEMEMELSAILDRKVDLVSRKGIERSRNWIRKKAILESAQPYYVA